MTVDTEALRDLVVEIRKDSRLYALGNPASLNAASTLNFRADQIEGLLDGLLDSWIPYDYTARDANPLPERGKLVWIYDSYYHGVTVGQWNGWWETADGSDDVGVMWWMPLTPPPAPGDADE